MNFREFGSASLGWTELKQKHENFRCCPWPLFVTEAFMPWFPCRAKRHHVCIFPTKRVKIPMIYAVEVLNNIYIYIYILYIIDTLYTCIMIYIHIYIPTYIILHYFTWLYIALHHMHTHTPYYYTIVPKMYKLLWKVGMNLWWIIVYPTSAPRRPHWSGHVVH